MRNFPQFSSFFSVCVCVFFKGAFFGIVEISLFDINTNKTIMNFCPQGLCLSLICAELRMKHTKSLKSYIILKPSNIPCNIFHTFSQNHHHQYYGITSIND